MNITVTVDDKEIIKSQVKIQKIQKYEEDLQNLEVLLQKEQVRAKEAEQYVEDLKSQVITNKERISQLEKELNQAFEEKKVINQNLDNVDPIQVVIWADQAVSTKEILP